MFLKKSTIKVVAIVATMFVTMGNNCASNNPPRTDSTGNLGTNDLRVLSRAFSRDVASIPQSSGGTARSSIPQSGVSLVTHNVTRDERSGTDRFGNRHSGGGFVTSSEPAVRIGSSNDGFNAGMSVGRGSLGLDVGYSGNSVGCGTQ